MEKELKENNLPPLIEITSTEKGPIAVFLSEPFHSLPLLLEGGRASPLTIHLTAHPDNIHQEKILDFEGDGKKTQKTNLFLKEGYTFDSLGQCYLVKYNPFRPIHYFSNSYMRGTYFGSEPELMEIVKKSIDLQKYFSGVMCGNDWFESHISDKILTRILVEENGVGVPHFIAFICSPPIPTKLPYYSKAMKSNIITLVENKERDIIEAKIKEAIGFYKWQEVVVKPSGSKFCGGEGVHFFNTSQVDLIVSTVCNLISCMGVDEGVLVDERIEGVGPITTVKGYKELDCCFRLHLSHKVFPERISQKGEVFCEGITTGMLARFGPWGDQISVCVGGFPQTFDFYCEHAKLTPEQKEHLREGFSQLGVLVLNAIDNYFSERKKNGLCEEEPEKTYLDFIGIDVCVKRSPEGFLHPSVVEINDQEADGMIYLDELHPENKGGSVREYVKTILFRTTFG
eukprot:TRINITY_DN8391_c0_g1_i1.p1 TRINITY_DN8391_c0_g1~~TRINITY_DN8391_c0_g1_i1.p1  ORF type:complete len:456 (-),score=73.70 TRINITY_DN8391_c0_g1_i1:137-1504(-)